MKKNCRKKVGNRKQNGKREKSTLGTTGRASLVAQPPCSSSLHSPYLFSLVQEEASVKERVLFS